MSRTLVDSDSMNDYRSDIPKFNIYIGEDVSRSTGDSVLSAFSYAYGELEQSGKIPGYDIHLYESDFLRSDYTDVNAINAVSDWRMEDNDYTNKGLHLGLHNGDAGNPGAAGNGLIYNKDISAQMPCSYDGPFIDNHALHESFHTIINHDLSNVSGMAPNGEHQLGKVYDYSNFDPSVYSESPLGDPGTSDEGSCVGATTVNAYENSPTACTRDAVGYTHNDVF